MKNFYLLFSNVEYQHLFKDVFLVPYYIKKHASINKSYIVFPETNKNIDLPKFYKGINLIRLKNFRKSIKIPTTFFFLTFMFRNRKDMDVLMLFHLSMQSFILGAFYKILKKDGFLYIKTDGEVWLNNTASLLTSKQHFFKKFLIKFVLRKVNLISIESKAGFELLNKYPFNNLISSENITSLPNGFDEEEFKSFKIDEKNFEEKDNLIITVGRLGSYPKNTEMLLSALEKVDLKDWKVICIGNIEKEEQDFQQKINDFYTNNPHLKSKVEFTGKINDRRKLYEYYNKAKIFVLTSRYEGFCLSLVEAARFKNIILSTDVGGAVDVAEISDLIYLYQDDPVDLALKLQKCIDGEIRIDKNNNAAVFSYDNAVQQSILKL